MSDIDLFHEVMGMIRGNKYETANEMVHAIIQTVWQAARQAPAPATAAGTEIPTGWKLVPREFLTEYYDLVDDSNFTALHKLIRKNAISALLTTPTPATTPETEWVKCEDRLPTEDDADFEYRLWCWFPERGDMKLLLLDQIIQSHLSGLPVQWKPTGLKRPTPPQEQPQ